MPIIVRDIDRNAATIIMVDSNLQRENILPSERAKAYKMKLEAIKRLKVYPLYVGNIDTCTYFSVPVPEVELSRDAFYSLAEPFARPYHTELQMCRSMLSLQRNIQREATIQESIASG